MKGIGKEVLKRIVLNRYAWKVHMETKDLKGPGRCIRLASGAARELLAHRFDLWDYMRELRENGYILEFDDGTRFFLPYCRYFDTVQMTMTRNKYYYERNNLEYLRDHVLKPGMAVLDIGANIGNHTVFFAKECGASHVYSFEPQADVYAILERNIALNGLGGVCTAYDAALGAVPGKARVASYDRANCGATELAMDEGGGVDVRTLDGMDFPEIGFVKIDVEGFEYDVLKGGRRFFASMSPDIYIEIKDDRFAMVNGLLESYGYAMAERIYSDYLYRKRASGKDGRHAE